MNVPGVHFNNSNWPYIVKALRVWAMITMITVPLLCLLLSLLFSHFWWTFALQNVILILYLAGLFVPIYVVGKNMNSSRVRQDKKKAYTFLLCMPSSILF